MATDDNGIDGVSLVLEAFGGSFPQIRSKTPIDPVMVEDFYTSPGRVESDSIFPRELSPNISSQNDERLESPENNISDLFGKYLREGLETREETVSVGQSVQMDTRPEDHIEQLEYSQQAVQIEYQPENQMERPARAIREETSYDDEETDKSEKSNGDKTLSDVALSPKSVVAQPIPSISAGPSLFGNFGTQEEVALPPCDRTSPEAIAPKKAIKVLVDSSLSRPLPTAPVQVYPVTPPNRMISRSNHLASHRALAPTRLTDKNSSAALKQRNTTHQHRNVASTIRKILAPLNIDDSDDEIQIIDPSVATNKARQKWYEETRKRKASSTSRLDSDIFIKKEKRDENVPAVDEHRGHASMTRDDGPVVGQCRGYRHLDSRCHERQLASPPPSQPNLEANFGKFQTENTVNAPSFQQSEFSQQSFSEQSFDANSSQRASFHANDSQPPQHQERTISQPSAPPKPAISRAEVIAAQKAKLMNSGSRRGPGLMRPLRPEATFLHPNHNNGEGSSAAAARGPHSLQSRLTMPSRLPNDPQQRNPQQGPVRPQTAPLQSVEDHSWMQEEDEISFAQEDYERWKRGAELFEKMKKKGTITEEQELMLHKFKMDMQRHHRLIIASQTAASSIPESESEREVAAEGDDEDSLFIPDNQPHQGGNKRPPPARRHNYQHNNDGEELEVANLDTVLESMMQEQYGNGPQDDDAQKKKGLTKSGMPRKPRAKVAKNAREAYDNQQDRIAKERSKAQKKKAAPKLSAKARGKAVKNSPKRKVRAKGKTKAKGKGKENNKGKEKTGSRQITNGESLMGSGNSWFNKDGDQFSHIILNDLIANDPIADRLHPVFDVAPEVAIHGRQNKETQFQTLFANIPSNEHATGSVRTDKRLLREASKSFGYARCKAQDGKWLITGMKSTLYHHQLLGAQWMVQRELSSQPPHGGLLADSMGLGKTVQMLACMVGNPPGPADIARKVKATLIVVPSAVLDQWKSEIKAHTATDMFPKIERYRSSSPISRAVLEDLDIVLTTYHEVMKEFPFPDKNEREEIAALGYRRWWKKAIQSLGTLHQISWYRVVLDEAQAIKNNSARTSLACQNLRSVYRWCLTGTPLLNRLEELFPYLRFLKANYSMDLETFRKYFCDPEAATSYSRISTVLSYCMMRRTMKTTILNRPIITLPKPHPELLRISFSPEETIIYRITENRFRANLNRYFAEGETGKNYGFFMVQLLRLRQCTSHPFMLERTIRESWTLEDVEELRNQLARLRRSKIPFYEHCKVWTERAIRNREAPKIEDAPDEYTESAEELMPFGVSDYGHTFSLDKALKSLSEKELFERVLCGLCSDIPNDVYVADCGHMFCKECIENFFDRKMSDGADVCTVACPTCARIIVSVRRVEPREMPVPIHNPWEEDGGGLGASDDSRKGKKERKIHGLSKGRDALGFEPWTPETWLSKSDVDKNFPLTPSAKTTALKSVLLKGFKDAPVDKVVIYVQFRTIARIVGRICSGERWGFLYLTGDSSMDHRTKAINKFREDDNIKILIAGLKCGGLGLNFPWANRCISLDLWWNHAVEQQAFGRIFRIGQKKETYMTRITIKNSVDQRMLSMQMKKLVDLEKAITDDPNNTPRPKLSMTQLSQLFGFLRKDEKGNIISVESDYDDEDNDKGEGGCDGEESEEGDESPDFGTPPGPSGFRGWVGGDGDGNDDDEGDNAGEGSSGAAGRGGRGGRA